MNKIKDKLGIKPIEQHIYVDDCVVCDNPYTYSYYKPKEVRELEQQRNETILNIATAYRCKFYPDGEPMSESGHTFLLRLLDHLTGIETEKIKEMIK